MVGVRNISRFRSPLVCRRCAFNRVSTTMKKYAIALGSAALMAGAALAEGEAGFDPSTLMSSATTTVSGIVTALGTLLAAAAGIYLAFVGWRKFREACNKV